MRWMRGLLWTLFALLLLWGAAWLAVPALVRWQVPKLAGEALGRPVTLGDASFAPWNLRLTLHDLAVAGTPGDAAPQLSVARLQVDLDTRSLLRLAPVVEALQIDAPRLRVTRGADGRFDVDDVLQRLAPKPGEPPAALPHFALYNVALRDGEVDFDDRLAQRRHRLSALTLALPFLSSVPSQVQIKVEPQLGFVLDGARYDSTAVAVPFAPSPSGTLNLRVAALDLDPFLAYLPATLPLRVQRGRADADLALAFAAPEQGAASVTVSGKLALHDLAVTEPNGAPLLGLAKLSLALTDVQPLVRKAAIGALRVEGLQLHLERDANGALSLQRLQIAPAAPAADPDPPWQVSVDALEFAGAGVHWKDAAVQPASAWVLDAIDASAQQLHWPAATPIAFTLRATLRPQGDAAATLAVLALQGQAGAAAASARIDLSALSVAAFAPYANAAQRVRAAGTGAASGELTWAARTETDAMRLRLALDTVAIDGLELAEPQAARSSAARGGATVAAQRVQLSKVALDLAAQSVAIGSARLQRPELRLERTSDGAWNVSRLAGPPPLVDSARPLIRAAAEATWLLRLDDLALDGGRVDLVDALPAPGHAGPPVRLGIEALQVGLSDLQLRGATLVSTPRLQLTARVVDPLPGHGREQPGRVEWRGRFGLAPLRASGGLRVERFPVDAVQAYAPHPLNLRLQRAEAGFQGEIAVREDGASGVQLDLAGDVLLSDLKLVALDRRAAPGGAAEQELLSWQSFAVNGLVLALRPGALPKVAVREASLSDFFARLVLTEDGELNLRGVAPPRAPPAAAAPAGGARLPLELDLGGLRLTGGRVDFSDRFVKPNYSAALTELNGDVGAFRSGAGEAAALRLSGRVAGTGLLEIDAKLKPDAVPRELDVHAKASEVELAPLSPYAGKYAGYAIERGKLSLELRYQIDPAGKLVASHQLVLNQLTFGERVDSPSATKLPVLLAVALLKDRHGVIDIDLPVSGSLDDPQFSLGPIIWQVIVNLLAKAVTAPFALLAGGGGPDISTVAFVPGTARPADDGKAAIDKVAKALADRPALKITVVGEADIDAEREAYQRANVEQRLQQELRREQLRASGASAAAPDALPPLAGDDRSRVVRNVYRETDLPDKPRNWIGLKADIAPDEMEALLRAGVKASPEAMRELALQRGLAVRDALIAKGLPGERLFVGAPRVRSGGDDKTWMPQVKLTLDTR